MLGTTTVTRVQPWVFGLATLLFTVAFADGSRAVDAEELSPGGSGRVVTVTDGDTVTLDNGVEIRLVGLQAPKLALGRPNFVDWPLADEARRALERLVLGKIVELRFGGRREDRHGRVGRVPEGGSPRPGRCAPWGPRGHGYS